jgi:hypothetical protein
VGDAINYVSTETKDRKMICIFSVCGECVRIGFV